MPDSYLVVANAAARDSRIPHPTPLQAVGLIDTGEVLYWYGPSIGWRPAWNTPWGVFARAATITTVPVSPGSLPGRWPSLIEASGLRPVTGRRYMAEFDGAITSNVNGDLISILLQSVDEKSQEFHNSETTWQVNVAGVDMTPVTVAWDFGVTFWGDDRDFRGGHTYTVNLAAYQVSGSGGVIAGEAGFPSRLTITDVGSLAPPQYR